MNICMQKIEVNKNYSIHGKNKSIRNKILIEKYTRLTSKIYFKGTVLSKKKRKEKNIKCTKNFYIITRGKDNEIILKIF